MKQIFFAVFNPFDKLVVINVSSCAPAALCVLTDGEIAQRLHADESQVAAEQWRVDM